MSQVNQQGAAPGRRTIGAKAFRASVSALALGIGLGASQGFACTVTLVAPNAQLTNCGGGIVGIFFGPTVTNLVDTLVPGSSPIDFTTGGQVSVQGGSTPAMVVSSTGALPEIDANVAGANLTLVNLNVVSDSADAAVFGDNGVLTLVNTDITNTVGNGVNGVGTNLTVTLDAASSIVAQGNAVLLSGGLLTVNNNGGLLQSNSGAAILGGLSTANITSSGTITGTGTEAILLGGGGDTVTISGGTVTGRINTGSGADTVNLNGGTTGATYTGDGNDTINITAGTHGVISGGFNDDTITLSGGSVAEIQGEFQGGGVTLLSPGNDTIVLSGGSVVGDVRGMGVSDTITLSGASIGGSIYGDFNDVSNDAFGAADVIALNSGTVAGGVFGEAGDDTITLAGAAVTGNLDGGADNDTFNLNSGSFGGSLLGGAGDDYLQINAPFDLAGIIGLLDGGAGTDDEILFNTSGSIAGETMVNWETISVSGGDTVVLTGAGLVTSSAAGSGLFANGGGVIDLDDGFAITGNLTLNGGGGLLARTAGGTGVFSVSGDFVSGGTVDMSGATPAAGDLFDIAGNYTVNHGVSMDAALDATLAGDSIRIGGTITGTTDIQIIDTAAANPGTATGRGPGVGILLVDNSAGPGAAPGQFTLSLGPITKNLYIYDLSTETDGNVYLQSTIAGQALSYGILGAVMRDELPTLRERLGQRRYTTGRAGPMQSGAWIAVDHSHREIRNDNADPLLGADWNQNRTDLSLGYDFAAFEMAGGQAVAGFSFHIIETGAGTLDNALASGTSTTDADGYGVGAALTWFGGGGMYVDVQARYTGWDAEISSTTGGAVTEGESWGLAVEAGKRFALGATTTLTPRAQVAMSDTRFDGFTDSAAIDVTQGNGKSLILSGGMLLETEIGANSSFFADLAFSHETEGNASAVAGAIEVLSGMPDSWANLTIGASAAVGEHGSAYLAARAARAFGGGSGSGTEYGVQAGLRMQF